MSCEEDGPMLLRFYPSLVFSRMLVLIMIVLGEIGLLILTIAFFSIVRIVKNEKARKEVLLILFIMLIVVSLSHEFLKNFLECALECRAMERHG